MKIISIATFCVFACVSTPQTYAAESTQTASNGVAISINADEFADRYEYSAPSIKFGSNGSESGIILLARIRSSGSLTPAMIQGFVMYKDDWRRYSSAIFRGGEQATFEELARDVVTCASEPCTLSEQFTIRLSSEQIEKYMSEGKLEVQLRSQNADTLMIEVPEDHVRALLEVTSE